MPCGIKILHSESNTSTYRWGPTHCARGASPDPLWVKGRVFSPLPVLLRTGAGLLVVCLWPYHTKTAHKNGKRSRRDQPRRRIQAAPGGNEPKRCDRGDIPEETRENTNSAWVDEQQKNVHLSQCCVCGVCLLHLIFISSSRRGKEKTHTHTIKLTEQFRFGARLYTYKLRVDLCQLPENRKDLRANKVRTIPLPASLG